MNSGCTRPSWLTRVSRTMPRIAALERKRRGRFQPGPRRSATFIRTALQNEMRNGVNERAEYPLLPATTSGGQPASIGRGSPTPGTHDGDDRSRTVTFGKIRRNRSYSIADEGKRIAFGVRPPSAARAAWPSTASTTFRTALRAAPRRCGSGVLACAVKGRVNPRARPAGLRRARQAAPAPPLREHLIRPSSTAAASISATDVVVTRRSPRTTVEPSADGNRRVDEQKLAVVGCVGTHRHLAAAAQRA